MRRHDLLAVTAFVLVALASWRAVPGATGGAVPSAFPVATYACAGASEPLWIASGPAVDVGATETTLRTNGFVRALACGNGTLSLTARGGEVRGRGSAMTVSWRDRTSWEGTVVAPVRLEIDVPDAGWVVVAFHNDARDASGDRNLWLGEIAFAR